MKVHTIPFHFGDLITDTTHLSPAELGGYIRLLAAHYRMGIGGLPDDDAQLRRITGLDNKTWRNSRPTIMAYFTQGGDRRWVHAKVQKTLSAILSVAEQNAAKALKRWHSPDAAALPQQSPGTATAMQSNIHNPESIETEERTARAGEGAFERIFNLGIELFPQLAPLNASSIHQWLNAGADVDLDILPELRRVHGKKVQPRSWGLFTQNISDSKARREAPMPPGSPSAKRPARHTGFGEQDYFAGTEGFHVVG